jgi:hypothetical protein
MCQVSDVCVKILAMLYASTLKLISLGLNAIEIRAYGWFWWMNPSVRILDLNRLRKCYERIILITYIKSDRTKWFITVDINTIGKAFRIGMRIIRKSGAIFEVLGP